MRLIQRIWFGETILSRAARAALAPAASLFGGIASARNALYDRGLLDARRAPVPVISVGNITVGGTGKTPFVAYLVQELRARGLVPAVVLSDYGADEKILHARLNPDTTVLADRDRVGAIAKAAAAGADVVVIDDGFQHRRAARDLDVVLVSAEWWASATRLLPAGPLRESRHSLSRAGLVIVTAKAASSAAAREVARDVVRFASAASIAIVRFRAAQLVAWSDGTKVPMESMAGESVLVVSAVGDPDSFERTMTQAGAAISPVRFRDHHEYSAEEVQRLAVASRGHKYVVCTEKDAVKLGPLWPANAGGLWYVSQAVEVVGGSAHIDAAIDDALSNRSSQRTTHDAL